MAMVQRRKLCDSLIIGMDQVAIKPALFISLQGFEHHINQEHHIWAYIFFFIHLNDTKQSDYTALEVYVHRLVCISSTRCLKIQSKLSIKIGPLSEI